MKRFFALLLLYLAGGPIWAQDTLTDTLNIGRSSAQSPADLLRGRVSGEKPQIAEYSPSCALKHDAPHSVIFGETVF